MCKLIETFAPVASYFTVNVSSPNTPGLRNLQQAAALDDLLAQGDRRARARARGTPATRRCCSRSRPICSLAELDDVVQIARSRRVDGMIVGQHHGGAAADLARAEPGERAGRPVRPAAVSDCRRGCWRRPMCAPKARFR